MPGPQAAVIELSQAAKETLEQLVSSHRTEQQIAKRARIILAAGAGQDAGTISRMVGVARKTVSNWRQRWLNLEPLPLAAISVQERLEDLPRPGAPPRITADQRCELEALACEAPEQFGRPISQWSGREIADELIKQGIIDPISPRHAARLLKRSLHSPPSKSLLAERGQRGSLCPQK